MVDFSIVFCMFTRPGNSDWRFGDAEAHLVPPISPRHSPCSDPGEKESWRHGTRASLGQEFLSWKLGSWDWWFQTWRFYFPYIGWCARLTQVPELQKLIWLVVPNMTGLWLSISSKRDVIRNPLTKSSYLSRWAQPAPPTRKSLLRCNCCAGTCQVVLVFWMALGLCLERFSGKVRSCSLLRWRGIRMDRVHNGCWIVLDDLCVFVGFSLFTVGVLSGPKKCVFSHLIGFT